MNNIATIIICIRLLINVTIYYKFTIKLNKTNEDVGI